MEPRGLICVFAKPPVPGRVKTRLAARVGDVPAALLAGAFLADTWDVVSSVRWARTVLATTEGTASDFGLPGQPDIWLQGEGDLGKRLERIIQRGLTEVDFVIAIGADSPGLPERLLVEARDELARADAVLGPSDDGGFYLAGFKRCPPGLFDDLPWSQRTTFTATRARLDQCGMVVHILEPWFDVDQVEDLDRLRHSIEMGAVHAPATRRLLTTFSQGGVRCG